jgi:hypothetical protein
LGAQEKRILGNDIPDLGEVYIRSAEDYGNTVIFNLSVNSFGKFNTFLKGFIHLPVSGYYFFSHDRYELFELELAGSKIAKVPVFQQIMAGSDGLFGKWHQKKWDARASHFIDQVSTLIL